MRTLLVEYPEDLLRDVKEDDVARLAQEALIVRLYDLGKLSSGGAADALGVSRREFLDLLGRYGVSPFDESTDVEAESKRG